MATCKADPDADDNDDDDDDDADHDHDHDHDHDDDDDDDDDDRRRRRPLARQPMQRTRMAQRLSASGSEPPSSLMMSCNSHTRTGRGWRCPSRCRQSRRSSRDLGWRPCKAGSRLSVRGASIRWPWWRMASRSMGPIRSTTTAGRAFRTN